MGCDVPTLTPESTTKAPHPSFFGNGVDSCKRASPRTGAVGVQTLAVAAFLCAMGASPAEAQNRWWDRVPEQTPQGLREPRQQGPGADLAAPPFEPTGPTGPVESFDEEDFDEEDDGFQSIVRGISERPEYAWHWQRVLASIRIQSRFTAITASPVDPDAVYLGTDSYTVVRTLDGGVTWDEIELSPFLNQRRQFASRQPGSPNLQGTLPSGFNIYVDPPYRQRTPLRLRAPGTVAFDTFFRFSRPAALGQVRLRNARFQARAGGAGGDAVQVDAFSNSRDFGDTQGSNQTSVSSERAQNAGALGYIQTEFDVGNVEYPGDLLAEGAGKARSVEVVRIEICPGAAFPLFVATEREVLGSDDDGTTWVRLFSTLR